MFKHWGWGVAGTLTCLALVYFLTLHQIRGMAVWAFSPYLGWCDVKFGSPIWRLNGDIGVRDVRIVPDDPSWGDPIRIDEVVLHTPGWSWTYKLLFADTDSSKPFSGRGLKGKALAGGGNRALDQMSGREDSRRSRSPFPPADFLAIELKGLDLGMSGLLPASIDDTGWHSAAPFEAEGCVGDVYWSDDELQAMGLPRTKVNFRWEYRKLDSSTVAERTTLHAPGRSREEIYARVRSPDPEQHLFADESETQIQQQVFEVRDEGFVAARNRFCAERDGIEVNEFVDRHVQSVMRLLLASGWVPPPELERIYRAYAAEGSELVFSSEPDPSTRPEHYHHFAPADVWKLVNARLKSSAGEDLVRLSAAPVRKVPEDFTGSTWDLVALERDKGLLLAAMPFDENPEARLQSESFSVRTARRERADEEELAPTVEFAAYRAEPQRTRAEVKPVVLDMRALDRQIGDRVKVVGKDGRQHIGQLVEVDARNLTLRIRMGGGYAQYAVNRAQVSRVEMAPRG